MIFLLGFFLIILTIYIYYTFNRDLLSPSLWLLLCYDLCVFISFTQFNVWGDIEFKTLFIVLLGLIAFIMGSKLSNKVICKRNAKKPLYRTRLNISTLFIWTCFLFFIIVTYFNYKYTSGLAISHGFSSGYNFLTYARNAMADETMGYPLYVSIVAAQVIIYIILFDVLTNYINKDRIKDKFPKICCLCLYIVICLLSTGRTMLMNLIVYVLLAFCILLNEKNNWSNQNNGKIIKYGLIAIFILLASFWIIDYTLRASMYGTERKMWDQIAKYCSSSIYAFDVYLKKPSYAYDGNFETLQNLFSLLNKFGANFKIVANSLETVIFSNVSTNVYTAMRRYIHDFGYMGMFFMQFLQGYIFQSGYKLIKNGKSSFFSFLIFCTFSYTYVFNCIEERFLVNVLSLRSLIIIFVAYFVITACDGNYRIKFIFGKDN